MLWCVVGLQFLAFQRIILPSTSGSCSPCPICLYISTDKDNGLGVWSVGWGHGALAAGLDGRLSRIWGSNGHINFWVWRDTLQYGSVCEACCVFYQITGISTKQQACILRRLLSIFPIHLPCFSMHLVKQFESLIISWNKTFQLHLMTFLHYFSPCLTTILDAASSILIHQLLSLILKIMHQLQFHEGIFSSRCSQTNHILQSKSRLSDTRIQTLFYLTTVVSHFTVSLLHLTIPPCNTKLVCYMWSVSVSHNKTLPASSFNVMSKTVTSTAIYWSKPHGPQAHSKTK